MSVRCEGKIIIPFEEFLEFVYQYVDHVNSEIIYGVPKIKEHLIEISYAADNENHPSDWAEVPLAIKEWAELKLENIMKKKECKQEELFKEKILANDI